MQWWKDRDTDIKTPALLFSGAIESYLADSWPGLNFICETKYKNLEIDKHIEITFPLERHLAYLKNLFFVFVSF